MRGGCEVVVMPGQDRQQNIGRGGSLQGDTRCLRASLGFPRLCSKQALLLPSASLFSSLPCRSSTQGLCIGYRPVMAIDGGLT